jgi:CBS domain-containing protein/mannitol/fructose-specific phosphotransferase system IIA component (Ntr-type)
MKLSQLLSREHIVVPLTANSLPDALTEVVRQLQGAGAIRDVRALDASLNDLRSRDLVLIGSQVALPHYRTNAVDHLVVGLGVANEPLIQPGHGSEDAPRIVALILAPPEEATLYLQTVSALARLLRQEGVVDQMLNAQSPADILTLPALSRTRVIPRLTVRDIMVHTEAVTPDLPVRDAVDLMIRRRVRALPVLNEKQEVLGIISEWDVMRGLLPQIPRPDTEDESGAGSAQLKVRDIMTRSVLCISDDEGIEEAASMMINKDVEQFPVVSEGKLIGFLSRSDIIRKLFGR